MNIKYSSCPQSEIEYDVSSARGSEILEMNSNARVKPIESISQINYKAFNQDVSTLCKARCGARIIRTVSSRISRSLGLRKVATHNFCLPDINKYLTTQHKKLKKTNYYDSSI